MSAEVAASYVDVWGRTRQVDPQTRRALEKALGPARRAGRHPAPEGGKCYLPESLELGRRYWGFTVQLYGLRSARNWGIGDFGDLRALVELSARLGAGFVGVNPLHATAGASPYSPSSRHALNFLYIDVTAVPGFEESMLPAGLDALRETELVDYDTVRARKLHVLEFLFKRQKNKGQDNSSRELHLYALFEALREKFGGGWQGWPKEYRAPGSKAVREFEKKHRRRVEFHLFVQQQARAQLDAVQRRARELGMPIGLYVDLALGADAGGAEVWADQDAYALGVSVGAPPDEFNPKGQDWGLPPYSPRALRAKRYEPFAALLRANMPEGGALRMDHVMSLMRLWWIPRGNPPERGAYVRYPMEDLLAILARESRERRCLVVGEDLGTVPPEFRRALNEAGVLSYRPLIFEKEFPRQSLVCVTTHDLPTWEGFFRGHDLELRESLGLSVDPAKEREAREQAKQALDRALGGDRSSLAAHLYLARTPAMLLAVQPEDVFDVVEQANLPGTVDQHPNWRRKLPLVLEDWAVHRKVKDLAERLKPLRAVGPRVPRATYRLQLHKDFRFKDATALVPYLARLGISHVYTSPFLKARAGSRHGYDVVDHNALNPEIGTQADFDALLEALDRHGMGLVMDIVPNHMGVMDPGNAWWTDVLARGRGSPYAKFFDIDWEPAKPELRGKVLLGILGDHYGDVLERKELKLARGAVRYYAHDFPLSPQTAKAKAGDPLALHELLERQNYRLAFWRVASDEINYRRFFEIVDLAALRQEDPEVFEATHRLVARLAQRPGVDGLRVDHPDGLADPQEYFRRLLARCGRRWVVVEKILEGGESLPEDWAVDGETGYRFTNLLTRLFMEEDSERFFDRIYARFTGERRAFDEISRESRLLIMGTTLAADLNRLAYKLARIASGNRFTRDYTTSGLRQALSEVAAHFPVYRTYVTSRGASETDRAHVEHAIRRARRASRAADPSVFDFIRSVLLNEVPAKEKERNDEVLRFAMRFQQFTAPVVAKGVEDTAFYRYHRLVALNEVGGDPGRFAVSLRDFHAAAAERAKRWPRTMLATTTHDTKRSEDARARLSVLSEMPSVWRLLLRRWSLLNREGRRQVEGRPAPAASDEYLFYQSLIGIWGTESLEERLSAYMLKAVREAKERTSWINPDAEYEAALQGFVEHALGNRAFLDDLDRVMPRIARLGMLVSLSQAAIKVASPGVPDYYQGTELWDFSLVDPDNRRPVDYELRRRVLNRSFSPREMLEDLESGKAKAFLIEKGLALRDRFRHSPTYIPLYADGGREENIVAFVVGGSVVAVAPRLFAGLMEEGDLAPLGEKAWGASMVSLPQGRFLNAITGENHPGGAVRVADLLANFPVALLART